MTRSPATDEVAIVTQEEPTADFRHISVALCVESDAFDRLGRVLRHLAVGLIDQAAQVHVIGADARVSGLALGPIRAIRYRQYRWSRPSRQLEEVTVALGNRAPTVVHAMTGSSYLMASQIAAHYDADLLLNVSSMSDCQTAAGLPEGTPGVFMVATEPLVQALRESAPVEDDRINLVRPGVFVASEVTSRLRAWSTPSILCTSPFEQESGVDHLLWAMGRLRQRGIQALLFLLGRGRYEASLRKLVRSQGLNSQVTFAAPLGDPLDAMKGADIFVRPSRDTAFHVDSLQAMGMGLATVAYPSSISDHLHHDETACVCDPATPEALADALARLIGDRAYTQRLATSAREYVRQLHTISQMAERTAEVYRELALAHGTIPLPEQSS